MKNYHLLFLYLIFTLTSCSDEPLDPLSQLPAITMTGENTFGCLVNGEVWVPEGSAGFINLNPDAKYNEASTSLQLRAKKINSGGGIQETMHIYITPSTTGEYEFRDIQTWTYAKYANPDCIYYTLDTSRYNFINISKLDKINDIISGTFDFKVINAECQDTLHFSDGRFDMIYHL